MDVCLGQIVYSKAGRDFGRLFVVMKIVSDEYFLLVDGDLRKITRPKKKKRKHIVVTDRISIDLANKFKQNNKVYDSEVRKVLAEFEETNERE